MFMLVATLCIKMDATSAACRRAVRKPVSERIDCERMKGQTFIYLREMAEELGARVLFISVGCALGQDT